MMDIGLMETVPSLDRDHIMYQKAAKLEHSFDGIQAKASTLRSELTSSYGIDAAQVVELDLYDDDSEDEGEVMLLAMILLQLHGKFPGGFPDPLQHHHNKKKRQRTSPDQLAILEQIFTTDKMPSQQTRVQLADQLGMSSRRVQIWFQNKRAKVKRGVSKSSEITPDQFDGRDPALSSSSGSSEPSSPIVPDTNTTSSFCPSQGFPSPSSSSSSMSSPPNSPAVVPSSPSLPHTLRQHSSQVSPIQFSLSPIASQPMMLTSEFSAMTAC
jgi:hypothetical protein